MRLDEFFAAVAPYLEGRADEHATRARLWGDAPPTDATRLALYGRFCAGHRDASLASVYPHLRGLLDGDAWRALVDDYYAAHPMHHWELHENGARLAEFLDGNARAGVPDFAAALADFEWWEWRTRVGLDEDAAPGAGPLRLAATVEVRPYAWDLCGWLDEEPRPEAPARRDVHVLFWRDRDGDPRREEASLVELHALKAVLDGKLAAPAGLDEDEWRATLDDLHEAGVLVGAR